jgi:4a-hydroxytetrahydrobiopterin dehydratase
MPDAVLSDEEIADRFAQLEGWDLVDGRLHRHLEFADFVEAFGFMTQVALAAERLDHHPDWTNVWNRVDVTISSHDAGGLTARCFQLAEAVDRAA